jgi:hypothetical protein
LVQGNLFQGEVLPELLSRHLIIPLVQDIGPKINLTSTSIRSRLAQLVELAIHKNGPFPFTLAIFFKASCLPSQKG